MQNENEVFESHNEDSTTPEQKSDGQHGNRNQIFNNCTVNIYEEGKAIEVLQKQQAIDAKQSEWQNELIKQIVETGLQAVKDYVGKKPQSAKEAPKPASKKSTTKK